MKKISLLALSLVCVITAACGKKNADESASEQLASAPAATTTVAPTAPTTTAPAATSEPVEETKEQKELAKKKLLMEYSQMEESYLTDTRGSWAVSAKASSVYGEKNKNEAEKLEAAMKAANAPDTQEWSNNNFELGFDWLELAYEKPVTATEVRVVLDNGSEALSKIELQDESGKWHTVWSGISDIKKDQRGARTWFVKSFEPTKYKTKNVKISFANNLEHTYKTVDAVQLIGN